MHATIIMEGRLVTDPEIKSGKNGDYCTFRFVVNTKYGNQDNASFFNCTASEYIANRMQKAGIKKGRLIEIIGNLNLRPYETDEGIRQISADVSVLEWHFMSSDYLLLFPSLSTRWIPATIGSSKSSSVV